MRGGGNERQDEMRLGASIEPAKSMPFYAESRACSSAHSLTVLTDGLVSHSRGQHHTDVGYALSNDKTTRPAHTPTQTISVRKLRAPYLHEANGELRSAETAKMPNASPSSDKEDYGNQGTLVNDLYSYKYDTASQLSYTNTLTRMYRDSSVPRGDVSRMLSPTLQPYSHSVLRSHSLSTTSQSETWLERDLLRKTPSPMSTFDIWDDANHTAATSGFRELRDGTSKRSVMNIVSKAANSKERTVADPDGDREELRLTRQEGKCLTLEELGLAG